MRSNLKLVVSNPQRQIEESLGLTTKIVNRKNSSGKVIVEYKNLDQFDMLLKLLAKRK